MKKFFFIILLLVYSCGYQPIYLNKTVKNYEFKELMFDGDNKINNEIIKLLSLKENEKLADKLFIKSNYQTEEISKDTKGQVTLYKDIISIDINVRDINNKLIKNKSFSKQLSYNNKANKFELVEYQNFVKNDLLNTAINEIIIFLNSK
jgi:hypothetical protein